MTEVEEIIPKNATIRQEYVKCGKFECKKKHGPYYYAYWKEKGKLKKKYIGKDYVNGFRRLCYIAEGLNNVCGTWTEMKKIEYIAKQAEKGNELAQEYMTKRDAGTVSIDWAYRQIKNNIQERRIFKAIRIAKKKGFEYNHNLEELYKFIGDDMVSNGLEINDDAIDSYLNTKIM